jgi:hypothetical protein
MQLPSPVLNLSVPPRQIPPDKPWFRPSPGDWTPNDERGAGDSSVTQGGLLVSHALFAKVGSCLCHHSPHPPQLSQLIPSGAYPAE